MAFSKVKVGGLADDSVTAANIDDDGTGYTVGNLTNSGTLQQTGQVTLGTGSGSGGNWTLPTSRGTDKYVLQINGTTGAADWAESLTAPEISAHNFDVSGSTDDGGINAYEAPYELTGTTNATTTISAITTTNLLVGQYISGAGIPADTTISSISSAGSSNNGTIVISNAVTVAGTQTGVAIKVQKTPGEKNGGKVTLQGANFGNTIGEISVAITNSAGSVIANASYLSGLSGGNTIIAEWTGTEGTYSTDLTSSYTDPIYFKMTKSGLSSNVHNTNATLTSDPAVTALSGSSQTGGDVFTDPTSSSLGAYGSGGRVAGGGQDSNTKLLLNFDRTGGTDIEDSSNTGGDGRKITATNAVIKASPFGDGKSAMFFDGSNDILRVGSSADFGLGSGAFTVEGWAYKSSATNASGVIFSTRTNSSGWSTEWQLRMHSNGYFTWFPNGGGSGTEKAFSNFSYAVNTWYHFALVRDSNNTIELFINGISRGTHTDSTNYNVAKELQIGAQYTSSSDNWFSGYLDDLRIVKGTAVYTGDFDVPTSRLTAITNTKLLIHSDINLESSDSKHLITHEGNVTYNTTSPKWSNRSAMYFDGSTGTGIRIPHSYDFDFGTGAFTIRGWVKPSSASATEVIFSVTEWAGGSSSNGSSLQLRKGSSNWLLDVSDGSNWVFNASGGTPTTNWQHFVVTKASGSAPIKVIIDGSEVISTSNISAIASFSSFDNKDFVIGGYTSPTSQRFTGYLSDFEVLKGENTTTSPINSETTKSTNTKLLLLGTTAGLFADSATSGTTHTITPTGSYHSQDHGGIAPALTWPASLKKTGSSGMFFNGTNAGIITDTLPAISGALTVDMWFYPITVNSTAAPFIYRMTSGNGSLLLSGTQIEFTTFGGQNFTTGANTVNRNQWNHFCYSRDGSGNYQIFINGTRTNYSNGDTADSPNATMGIGYRGSSAANYHHGYITNFRISNSDETASGGTLYNSSATAITLPTRAYGAYGPSDPDVGTITLTATGEGDFTWSEMSQGTALPGTLAVSSTTHSGSGNSRTHTATITGKFPVNTSTTYTNGIKGDTATNNILLKVQHDTDATKAVTLNGTTGMGITQKASGRPILFNARRYAGKSLETEISGLGFQPDFVWIKERDSTSSHRVFDSIRGATNYLAANETGAQGTAAATLKSFTKDGFTVGSNDGTTNEDGKNFISWTWKAGGAPSATGKSAKLQNGTSSEDTISTTFNTGTDSYNTASGHVTSVTRSVNMDGGFSIVKYVNNGTGANRAIPHGLGSKPEMVIIKPLGITSSWLIYHKGLTSNTDLNAQFLKLESTDGDIAMPGSTSAATNYHFYTPNDNSYDLNTTNANGVIAYCWKSVAGVSAFGSFTGNASTYNLVLGFHPKFLFIRRVAAGSGSGDTAHGHIYDYFRSNRATNAGATDGTGHSMQPMSFSTNASVDDTLNTNYYGSNNSTAFTWYTSGSDKGVRINTNNGEVNGNGNTIIYMAFA